MTADSRGKHRLPAQEAALSALSRTDFSVAAMAVRLAAAGYDDGEVTGAIAALTRTGLLDDERYTRNYIELRLIHHPCGRALLLLELARKGVSEELAAQVLDELYPERDETAIAEKAVLTRFGGHAAGAKVAAFLASRGFGEEALRQYCQP